MTHYNDETNENNPNADYRKHGIPFGVNAKDRDRRSLRRKLHREMQSILAEY